MLLRMTANYIYFILKMTESGTNVFAVFLFWRLVSEFRESWQRTDKDRTKTREVSCSLNVANES